MSLAIPPGRSLQLPPQVPRRRRRAPARHAARALGRRHYPARPGNRFASSGDDGVGDLRAAPRPSGDLPPDSPDQDAPARPRRPARRPRPGGPLRHRIRPGRVADSAVAALDRNAFGYQAFSSRSLAAESSQTFLRGEPVSPGDRGDHHRRQRRLPAVHHAAQGGGAADRRRRHALRRRPAPTIFGALLLEAALVAVAGSACRYRLAFAAGAATNAYYRRFFDTALTFSSSRRYPGFSVVLSLALGLARGRGGRGGGWCAPADGALGSRMKGVGWGLKSLRRHRLRTRCRWRASPSPRPCCSTWSC